MKIVYASRQGKTKELVQALGFDQPLQIESGQERVSEPFILFTYSDKVGETPEMVSQFLENNEQNLQAVIATGSLDHHRETFCFGGQKVALKYGVPLLATVNGRSTKTDEAKILEAVAALD